MSGYYRFFPVKEDILVEGSKYFIDSAGRRNSEVGEIEEELMKMQNELAGEIYFQRCLEFGR